MINDAKNLVLATRKITHKKKTVEKEISFKEIFGSEKVFNLNYELLIMLPYYIVN